MRLLGLEWRDSHLLLADYLAHTPVLALAPPACVPRPTGRVQTSGPSAGYPSSPLAENLDRLNRAHPGPPTARRRGRSVFRRFQFVRGGNAPVSVGAGIGHVPVRREAFDGVTRRVQQRAWPAERRSFSRSATGSVSLNSSTWRAAWGSAHTISGWADNPMVDQLAPTCARCGSVNTYPVDDSRSGRTRLWECGDCEKRFHVARPRPSE